MQSVSINNLKKVTDSRGNLYISEVGSSLPFVVKRIYYIRDVTSPDIIRGYHAHKKLKQVFICLAGSCTMILDDGLERKSFLLNDPGISLYVGSPIWREMTNFTKDAVLMVLASEIYDENDYIRNYEDFKEYIGAKLI